VVEIVPLWLINVVSFTTVFAVMTAIGTTITPSDSLRHIRVPFQLARGIATAIVIVPVIGIAASFAFGLSLAEKVGIILMAIVPGAPLALRRALGSGADAGFAPTLQIAIAILAVPAVPLWVEFANLILGTQGFADPVAVARQVLLAQLSPLALGAVVRRAAPIWGARIGMALGRAGSILLIVAILGQVVDLHRVILEAQFRPIVVAGVTTIGALLAGHLMGRLPESRHAIAVASALRNIGLALLIATANRAPPTVEVVIVSYAITAIVIVSAYIALRGLGLRKPARR
jgi:BASS family bile acid:Na+ symporter